MKQLKTMYLAARGRLRSYGLLALILLSVFTSIGLQLTRPQTAMAASGVYANDALTKNVKAYALRNALAACIAVDAPKFVNTRAVDIADGGWFTRNNWFDSDTKVGVTHLVASDDGTRMCATEGFVNEAVNMAGWASNTEAACAAGYVRLNKSNCINGTGDFDNHGASSSKFQKAFDAKYGGLSFTPAMYYILYARSMEIGCKATPVVTMAEATPDQKALAGSEKGWSMKVVGADGTITETIYKAELERGRKITTTETPTTHSTQKVSCIDLVKNANKYASAYAAYVKAHPNAPGSTTGDGGTNDEDSGEEDTCRIDGVGWILCPVMTLAGKIIDVSYMFVSELLRVQPLFTNGETEGVYRAWSIMRNIANVAFVIAFLVIIYSQITGAGVSNYGIKRMLPRLIVAAVLVNISYWICAIAVDLSNVLGKGMMELFDVAEKSFKLPESKDWNSGEGWEGLVGAILAATIAGAAALYITLAALVPVLIPVLLAIVTVLLVLMLRHALIILLIVIAPLAFVAYLLPNTEQYFKKWRQLLQTLLLMYPIISLIFGASALASKVVMGSADNDNQAIKIAVQIMGAGISVIPLFITPVVMKTAGGMLNRFGGFVNNPNRGPADRARKAAEGLRDRRDKARAARALSGTGMPVFGGGKYRRAYRRELRGQMLDSRVKSGQQQFGVTDEKAAGYVEETARNNAQASAISSATNSAFVNRIANGEEVSEGMGAAKHDTDVQRALAAQQEKAIAEAIRDVELTSEIRPGDVGKMGDELAAAIRNNDSITARAMQNMLLKSGSAGLDEYRKAMGRAPMTDAGGNETGAVTALKRNLLDNHAGVKEKAADLVKHAASDPGTTMGATSSDAGTWNKLSNEELVLQKSHSLEKAEAAGGITEQQAKDIYSDDQLRRKLDPKGLEIIKRVGRI